MSEMVANNVIAVLHGGAPQNPGVIAFCCGRLLGKRQERHPGTYTRC